MKLLILQLISVSFESQLQSTQADLLMHTHTHTDYQMIKCKYIKFTHIEIVLTLALKKLACMKTLSDSDVLSIYVTWLDLNYY